MNAILQQTTKLARGAAGLGVQTAARAVGAAQRLRHRDQAPRPDMDDATLKAKVESTVFRDAAADKQRIAVSVVDGVVELRGEVRRREQVDELAARARAVPEVRGVQSLLHLPKTPARKPRTTRSTAAKTKARAKPRTGSRPTTAESRRAKRPSAAGAKGEATPRQKAARGEGRTAAPLGTED